MLNCIPKISLYVQSKSSTNASPSPYVDICWCISRHVSLSSAFCASFLSFSSFFSSSALSSLPFLSFRFLIHNSGWVQPACYLRRASSEDIRRSVDLNLTSFSILNARFLRYLQGRREQGKEEEACQQREEKEGGSSSSSSPPQGPSFFVRMIQISSLAAVKPCPSLPLYCTVKAGRDMQMSVIAEEVKNSSDFSENLHLKTLNWAPGKRGRSYWRFRRLKGLLFSSLHAVASLYVMDVWEAVGRQRSIYTQRCVSSFVYSLLEIFLSS